MLIPRQLHSPRLFEVVSLKLLLLLCCFMSRMSSWIWGLVDFWGIYSLESAWQKLEGEGAKKTPRPIALEGQGRSAWAYLLASRILLFLLVFLDAQESYFYLHVGLAHW